MAGAEEGQQSRAQGQVEAAAQQQHEERRPQARSTATCCIFRRFRPPIPGQSDQVPERADAGVLLGLEVVGLRRRRWCDATRHRGVSGRQQASTQDTTGPRYAPTRIPGGRLQTHDCLRRWTRTSTSRPSMSPHCAPLVKSASASAVGVLAAGTRPGPSEGFWCRCRHRPSFLA